MAQRISETELLVYNVEECPKITVIIAESIVEGNNIHEWIVKKGLVSHPYLSTEEALKLGGRSLSLLREWVHIPLIVSRDYIIVELLLFISCVYYRRFKCFTKTLRRVCTNM